jgi:hypothetical protein
MRAGNARRRSCVLQQRLCNLDEPWRRLGDAPRPVSPLPGLIPAMVRARGGQERDERVSATMAPRHARPRAVGRRAGGIGERGSVPPGPAGQVVPARVSRRDPLAGPVTITEHCVIGDQIRVPAAWCDLGCGRRFADPAALGEGDNRARAMAAGWCTDACSRLVCPACQQRPGPPRPVPGPWAGAGSVGWAPGDSRLVGRGGAGRHRRAPWPPLVAAVAGRGNGHAAQLAGYPAARAKAGQGR